MFVNLGIWEIHKNDIFAKDGHREMMKMRLIQSQKSWMWDQYLSKNITWKFGNAQHFLETYKIFETKKQKTKKP